jgi:ubiquitin C-terminal hydrolase
VAFFFSLSLTTFPLPTTGVSLKECDASSLLSYSGALQRAFPLWQQHDAGEFFSLLMEALRPAKHKPRRSHVPLWNFESKSVQWNAEVRTRFLGGVSRFGTATTPVAKPPVFFSRQQQQRLKNPFMGHEAHSPIRCPECGPLSDAKYTAFVHLILDIRPGDNLTDSLRRYTKTVSVRDYQCVTCSARAGEPVEITIKKRTLLGQMPKALCLQLKLAGGDAYKIDAFVKFPLVLDLAPFSVASNAADFFGSAGSVYPSPPVSLTSSMSFDSKPPLDPDLEEMMRQLGGGARRTLSLVGGASEFHDMHEVDPMERSVSPGLPKEEPYQLCAVVVHLGIGVGAGHFVCYRRYRGGWLCANDEKVFAVDEDRVLSSHVYMLFYEKI